MNHLLFLMADGFEETEVVAPLDILRRGEVKVTLASIHENTRVEGGHGLVVETDILLSEADVHSFQGVFLPGGGLGVRNLQKSEAALDIIRRFYHEKKWVTAICAAPLLLVPAGIAQYHKLTSYPGVEKELAPYARHYSEERVVADGKVITSRSAGTAEEFGLKILECLEGKEKAEEVRAQILGR